MQVVRRLQGRHHKPPRGPSSVDERLGGKPRPRTQVGEVTLRGARSDAQELGRVLDGSTSGDEGCQHVHLALGRRPHECAAQTLVSHASRLPAAAIHSLRLPTAHRDSAESDRRPGPEGVWDLGDRVDVVHERTGFKVADPAVSAGVTPRHLLNHTNGIEEDLGDPGEGDDVYERIVANIADAPQVFPLGATHGYSAALGYAVLARIMEVLDGDGWDAIMIARLFDRLALTGTSSRHEDVEHDRAATGHIIRSLEEGPIVAPVPYLPRLYGPGGNVSSTARDVLTMAQVFLNGGTAQNGARILSPAGIREMMESRVPVPDPYMFGPEWGLGLIVCCWLGETVYAHDGSTIGQNARLRILPDRGLAIVADERRAA